MDTNTPDDEVMCHCSGTRRNNIQTLSEQGMDMDAISNWTGALTGCGGCEWDIADFLKELAARRARDCAFEVWRLDDNGNEFLVESLPDQASADSRIAELAAGGHKQTYWVRKTGG